MGASHDFDRNATIGEQLSELAALGGNVTMNVHRVDPDVIVEMLQDGSASEVKRVQREGDSGWYWVCEVPVGQIEVTLFTEDLPVPGSVS